MFHTTLLRNTYPGHGTPRACNYCTISTHRYTERSFSVGPTEEYVDAHKSDGGSLGSDVSGSSGSTERHVSRLLEPREDAFCSEFDLSCRKVPPDEKEGKLDAWKVVWGLERRTQ